MTRFDLTQYSTYSLITNNSSPNYAREWFVYRTQHGTLTLTEPHPLWPSAHILNPLSFPAPNQVQQAHRAIIHWLADTRGCLLAIPSTPTFEGAPKPPTKAPLDWWLIGKAINGGVPTLIWLSTEPPKDWGFEPLDHGFWISR